MWHVLSFLQKNLVWSIPIAMAVGLLYGYWFDASPLKQFIIPVTFIMVYPMMVTLNVKTIFKGQDAKLQITTQIINFVLLPFQADRPVCLCTAFRRPADPDPGHKKSRPPDLERSHQTQVSAILCPGRHPDRLRGHVAESQKHHRQPVRFKVFYYSSLFFIASPLWHKN